MSAYVAVDEAAMFAESRQRFDETVSWLTGPQADQLSHAVLEQRLQVAGRELLRQLLQDHLDLRAVREERLAVVVGQDAVARTHVERGHQRALSTVFGQVNVARIAYRAKGADSLFPADALANLPVGCIRTGCAGWLRSRRHVAPTPRPRRRSSGPAGCRWANDRSKRSPRLRPPTSTPSTTPVKVCAARTVTCWS